MAYRHTFNIRQGQIEREVVLDAPTASRDDAETVIFANYEDAIIVGYRRREIPEEAPEETPGETVATDATVTEEAPDGS